MTTTYKLKKDRITGNWYVQGLSNNPSFIMGRGLFVVPGTVGSRDKAITKLKNLKG